MLTHNFAAQKYCVGDQHGAKVSEEYNVVYAFQAYHYFFEMNTSDTNDER